MCLLSELIEVPGLIDIAKSTTLKVFRLNAVPKRVEIQILFSELFFSFHLLSYFNDRFEQELERETMKVSFLVY